MRWLDLLLIEVSMGFFYFIFYVLYKKLDLTKWLNKNRIRAIVVLIFAMTLSILCQDYLDKLNINFKYYDICKGMLLGILTGLIPHIIPAFNRKKNNS